MGSLVLMVVGAFGPWAKVLIITINGTDDGKDGWVVVGAAAVAAVFLGLYLWRRKTWLLILPTLAGCLAAATAGYDISDINSLAASELGGDAVSTEWGIYVALAGSISLILASVALIVETRRSRQPADLTPTPEPPAA